MTGNIFWKPAEDDILTKLWSTRMVTRKIAEALTTRFGRPFTHNMVIGRAHRLKLPRRESPINYMRRTR